MRKILGTLGIIFGFFGLATLVIFWAMAPGQSSGVSPGNLTADIAANVPDAGTSNAADIRTGVMGILGTTTPAPTTPAGIVLGIATGTAQENSATTTAPATTPAPSATSTPAAPTPTATPIPSATPSPTPTEPPFAPSDQASAPTSTTTTITVSETTPPPPPSSQPVAPKTAGAELALPYARSSFVNDADWQVTWGTLSLTNDSFLQLSAGPSSIGGAIYLKGAASWSNYTMNATVDLAAGRAFGLVANYIDASNYVLCEYSSNATGTPTLAMQLDQFVGGYEIALTPALSVPLATDEGNGTASVAGQDLGVSIRVNGQYGSCSLNGQIVSDEGIGPGKVAMKSAGSGSVGFTVSDPTPDTSQLTIKSMNVAP